MLILLALASFMQVVGTPVVPDMLANTQPGPPGEVDLHFADGTVWALTPMQGCDWLAPGLQVVWSPSADGSIGSLVQVGSADYCYVDTTVVWTP